MKIFIPVFDGGRKVWEEDTNSRQVQPHGAGIVEIRGCMFKANDIVYRTENAAHRYWTRDPVPSGEALTLGEAIEEGKKEACNG